MFQAHILKFMAASNGSIPVHSKHRYFRWFSIIRHTDCRIPAAKYVISTFSAEITNQKIAALCDFPAQNTQKCVCGKAPNSTVGAYITPPDFLAAGGEVGWLPLSPKKPTPALSPVGLDFLALGLKEVVHPWLRCSRHFVKNGTDAS